MPYVAIDWLGDHVELPAGLTAERLAADLVRVGLEEEAIHGAAVTGPLVVGRVLEMTPEPQKNGKTINWCLVDVGPEHNAAEIKGVEPADVPAGGARGIVCGAHNFAPGDLVVVALPGSVLPGPFPIASRKTYGHVSDGMICSQRELGLGEDHDGIIVLPRLGYAAEDLTPGQDAVALLGLGDEVLEINVTPDRGYAFSYRGVAREFSHSTGARFTDPGLPGSLPTPPPAATPDGFPVEVDDAAPVHGVVGCDRFVTRVVRGLDPAAQTPAWMQRRLTASGMRPISLAVDVTNYVMLDLGQPLHAYDLEKVAAPVVVRRAAPGERLTTLDDVDRALDPEDLLITDSPDGARGARVLGLAGVMGGASSEVGPETTAVLVEAAHFDPVTVARTSRRHKLSSEAAKRFERGVDPLLPAVAAQRVVDLLVELGGGTADPAVSGLDRVTAPAPIHLPVGEAERLVGVPYTLEQVVGTLGAIGCAV
ncbi:MAG: phenylalanine--tRNA ligase subunit beta, partial [Cellulosimicrobium funkei]